MAQEFDEQVHEIIVLVGDLVAAYVSNNPVPASELPDLIRSVHGAVAGLTHGNGSGGAASTDPIEKPSRTQIRKSVNDDGIVSFIDGRSYKTLKRHLSVHGLDPNSYRARYGLPADYPMVASSYAAQRSALAKAIGLGQVVSQTKGTSRKGASRKRHKDA